MPKIQRKTQKIFCNSADSDQLAVFGSMSTGTPVYSSDIEELQSNEAFDLGWDAATLEDKAPFMEEMNGVQYGLTYQIAYGLQEGIPEYDAATTYYIGSICKVLEDGKPVLYTSLTDNNIENDPVNDSTNWERLSFGGGGLEIGDIGFTQMAIDETKGLRRKLNGQLIIQDQYIQFTNIIKESVVLNPDLACTESEWQTAVTMSTNGVCYKFVIDDNAGTIRLPKYPTYFIAGLKGIAPVAGNGMTLGLSNPTTGNTGFRLLNSYFTGSNPTYGQPAGTVDKGNTGITEGYSFGITTDSSKSGIEARLSNNQTEQIKGIYFIQVATGAETEDNIINEIELNNPFSLLDYKYSEYELNNLSWLRSEGQYNSKAVYPAVYDLLLKIYNGVETKAGVSVKLTTEAFTDYDFVLNTSDETFRLPILTTNRVLVAKKEATSDDPIWYNLYSDGWCEQGGYTTLAKNSQGTVTYLKPFANANYTVTFAPIVNSTYGGAMDYLGLASLTATQLVITNGHGSQMSFYWNACGYAVLPTENNNLYFYVGETVQNANLINAGRIEEIKANKTDVDGQWVKSKLVLAYEQGISGLTNYTYDLSDYLPNDGYDYEVMFYGNAYTAATTNAYMAIDIENDLGLIITITSARTRSNAAMQSSSTCILPIGGGRSVKFIGQDSTNFNGKINLYALAYRRIGKNV